MIFQKMLGQKKTLKLNITFLVLCLAINIISFKYLPSKVALQIATNGDLTNFIPKLLFLFTTPLIILLIALYNYFKSELRILSSLIPVVIIFILNLIILGMNLFI